MLIYNCNKDKEIKKEVTKMTKKLNNMQARKVEDIFQDLVDDYSLDYGNGEITFENDWDVWINAVIEAPNNSTIQVVIDGSDYQALFNDGNGELEDSSTIRGILASEIHKAIEEWDAEETFKELWSRDFQYSPFEFVDMLREDEEFFNNVDDELLKIAI